MVFFGCIQQDRFRFPREQEASLNRSTMLLSSKSAIRQHIPRMQGRKNQRHAFPVISLPADHAQNHKGDVDGAWSASFPISRLKNGPLGFQADSGSSPPGPSPTKWRSPPREERCARGFNEKPRCLRRWNKTSSSCEPFDRVWSCQHPNSWTFIVWGPAPPGFPLDYQMDRR